MDGNIITAQAYIYGDEEVLTCTYPSQHATTECWYASHMDRPVHSHTSTLSTHTSDTHSTYTRTSWPHTHISGPHTYSSGRSCKTDDNGNTMLRSFLSKLFKKETGWRYSRTVAMGKTEKKCFLGLFVHAVARGGTCAFTLKIVNTLIKTTHATIGLRSRHRIKPRPTRFVSGKAGECRWRPRRYQVDPWSRGR